MSLLAAPFRRHLPARPLLPTSLLRSVILLLLLFLSSSSLPPVLARFYYPSFRDTRFLRLSGSASSHLRSDPPCVALTGGDDANSLRGNQTGAVWYERRVNMREKKKRMEGQGPDGFVTSFHFRITPSTAGVNRTSLVESARIAHEHSGLSDGHMGPSLEAAMVEAAAQMPSGGDGFAFVFRSIPSSIRAGEIDPTFGRGGSGLGYADLKGLGIVVEFDTKMDLQERDPNANHVSVHVQTPVDGESFTSYENDDARVVPLTYATLPLRRPRILSSRRKRVVVTSTPLVVQISYTPSLHLLKVFLNDLVSPILVVKDAPVISGEFQVGFTGSQSGESRDTQEICQWYFEKQEVSVAAMKGIRAAGVGAMKDSNSAAASSSHPTNAALASSPSSSSPPTTLPSSKPTAHESCDSGFTGESCTLDLTHLASECLTATSGGCSGCLAHPSGHCQWCASQARCISNELTTRSFDTLAHKPYCADPTTIVEDVDECSEAPLYILWGSSLVLFVIVVCVLIAVTGSLWLRSKTQATLAQDVATLVFYTLLGSLFSICMTSVVNVVLTEVTLSTDASANYALGLFFFLFGALLARDIWTVRSARRRALHHSRHGGLSSSSINSLSPTSLLLHDPDDAETGEKIVEAFERQQRQQREYEESPVGRTSSERLISGSGLYSHQASHRLFSSLTSVRGRLFVPMVFVGVSALAVMLCLFVLEPEWTSHYPVALRTVFYTLLATSLLFTLAYLFLTFWRLLKIVGQAVLCASGCPWRGGGRSSGGGRSGYGHQSDPIFDVGEDAPDLFESLSLFASTSLLSSVAQVRIMAVCAAISGVYFGHMFGRLDREDQTKSHLDLFVQRENVYSYPLAAFLGAMSSFTNHYLDLYRVTHTEAVVLDDPRARHQERM